MLFDKVVIKAVTEIRQRSERQSDLSKVSKTFVDPGILLEIQNTNHQLLYGRRGTGKTHAFRKIQYDYDSKPNSFCCYLDCRVLGSSGQHTDTSLDLQQ